MNISLLKKYWYPIVPIYTLQNSLQSFSLLSNNYLLWRSGSDITVCLDRCPHRGVKLSGGWINEQNCLVCPYHGLTYNNQGKCVKIPAHPDIEIPAALNLDILPIQERYGLIWVALDASPHPLPEFLPWDDPTYRQINCGPYYYHASAYRAMENFLDLAHFPFVHEGLLGDRSTPELSDYSVTRTQRGLIANNILVPQPNPDGTGKSSNANYSYQIFHPFVASLSKKTDQGTLFIFAAFTPINERETIAWMGLALNYGYSISELDLIAFQDQLVAQDIQIVESQTPQLISLNWKQEFPLPGDKLVVAYRKWLKDRF